MRFMSIIGLCLMAVFALVQGIPVQEQGKPAQPAQAAQLARLREEIRAQQQQLQELQAELHALQAEKDRTQQVLTVAQQHLEQLAGQTQQARAQRDRLAAQLADLDRQLEQGHTVLADIEQAATRKEQDLAELRGTLLHTQAQLDHSRREIEALQRPPRQQPAKPVVAKQPPPAPAAIAVPARQGFVLRFASDAALDRLVAAGRVKLYGMADRQAWQLSMAAGRPAVAQTTFPGWFHEMSAVTVPEHYIHSLENAADDPGPSTVVWGVQLPAPTRAAIASLTRGQQGGALVIQDDGQVTLED
jgi:ABC-type transporter Mla subunit MlaD